MAAQVVRSDALFWLMDPSCSPQMQLGCLQFLVPSILKNAAVSYSRQLALYEIKVGSE